MMKSQAEVVVGKLLKVRNKGNDQHKGPGAETCLREEAEGGT